MNRSHEAKTKSNTFPILKLLFFQPKTKRPIFGEWQLYKLKSNCRAFYRVYARSADCQRLLNPLPILKHLKAETAQES